MMQFETGYKQNVNWKSLFEIEEVRKEEKLFKIEKRITSKNKRKRRKLLKIEVNDTGRKNSCFLEKSFKTKRFKKMKRKEYGPMDEIA